MKLSEPSQIQASPQMSNLSSPALSRIRPTLYSGGLRSSSPGRLQQPRLTTDHHRTRIQPSLLVVDVEPIPAARLMAIQLSSELVQIQPGITISSHVPGSSAFTGFIEIHVSLTSSSSLDANGVLPSSSSLNEDGVLPRSGNFPRQRCLMQMILLAGPGVLISTFCLGVVIKLAFPFDWSWKTLLLLGGLLSATDPVVVVALLKELGVSKKLSTIIEGESLMNDGLELN